MTLEEQLRILKELEASKGWAIVRDHMNAAIVTAAMQMADGKPMPPEQYNFHRGAMWSAKRTVDIVPDLIRNLQNEIILQSDPAKAGQLSKQVSLRPDANKKDE